MLIKKTTVSFTASTTSAAISAGLVFAIQTPASFGVTAITLQYCDTATGTFLDIKDELGANIGITGVDSSNAAIYDLTNIFPLVSLKVDNNTNGYIKFKVGSSITKDVVIYQGKP